MHPEVFPSRRLNSKRQADLSITHKLGWLMPALTSFVATRNEIVRAGVRKQQFCRFVGQPSRETMKKCGVVALEHGSKPG